MSSINTYPSEVTPLVRSINNNYPRNVSNSISFLNRVVLLCFLAVLLVGTFCGMYLMSIEGETYARVERFDFVTQKEWGVNISQQDAIPSKLPFTKVILIQVEDSINIVHQNKNLFPKNNYSTEIMLDLNTDSGYYSKNASGSYGLKEIWYNFYVNAMGTIFEGRGFYLLPFYIGSSNVLTIGCKAIQDSDTTKLALRIKAFLDYGISKNMLNYFFEISAEEFNDSRKLADISFMINKWNKQ